MRRYGIGWVIYENWKYSRNSRLCPKNVIMVWPDCLLLLHNIYFGAVRCISTNKPRHPVFYNILFLHLMCIRKVVFLLYWVPHFLLEISVGAILPDGTAQQE